MVDALTERAEVEALLLLQRVPGLGDLGVKRLLAAFGSARATLAAPDGAFASALAGRAPSPRVLESAARRATAADRAAVAEILSAADARGMRVVPIGAPGYPARLLELEDPPGVLFLRGRADLLAETAAVAVVGSRRATGYGRRTAEWLGGALARAGVVVVSGLALGVDAEAHRGALDAGGATIAVLGAGADVEHPASNRRLFRRIARDGLIVSELPPGTRPLPFHFPRRNRIMAALAKGVVVVEAADGSGALITVEHATDLGRDVFAVPGPIDAPTSAGPNRLIADGAVPVLGPDAILAGLGVEPRLAERPAAPAPGTDRGALWEALGGRPLAVDELAGRAGLPARRALVALSLLEIEGWAVQSAGGRFARRRG